MGALILNLVLKNFLQEEGTRFYWKHTAAEFFDSLVCISQEKGRYMPPGTMMVYAQTASQIQGNLSGYLGTTRLPSLEVFSLSFDVGISQDAEIGRPCKTFALPQLMSNEDKLSTKLINRSTPCFTA